MSNTGGRVAFEQAEVVRILGADGRISTELYVIDSTKSDRKGHVLIKEKGTTRQAKVHFRRIIPISIEGMAVVIESAGKYRAVCPCCDNVHTISPADEFITCSNHGQFSLYWLGVKPMTENAEITEKPGENAEERPTKKDKPKTQRPAKVTREPIAVDLDAIANTTGCEVWTRKNVRFDHERIAVASHTVLFTGDDKPRKICFNTYNGTLGKSDEQLPIASFVSDTEVNGKKSWYAVKDVDKTRTKLQKDGYEQHK